MKLERILAGEPKHAIKLKYTFRPSMEEVAIGDAVNHIIYDLYDRRYFKQKDQTKSFFGQVINYFRKLILKGVGIKKLYSYEIHSYGCWTSSKERIFERWEPDRKLGELVIYLKKRERTEKTLFTTEGLEGNEEVMISLYIQNIIISSDKQGTHNDFYDIIQNLIERIITIEEYITQYKNIPGYKPAYISRQKNNITPDVAGLLDYKT